MRKMTNVTTLNIGTDATGPKKKKKKIDIK